MKAKKDTQRSLRIQAGKLLRDTNMSMSKKKEMLEKLQVRFMKVGTKR